MEDWMKGALFVGGAAVLLTIILVPLSFHGVEYYEYGFPRSKTSRKVDTTKVYGSGHWYVGVNSEFKKFQADAHNIQLKATEVFTSNRLTVNIDCSFQYFLRPEDLKLLHDAYDLQYKDILKNNAIDALKGSTTNFTTLDFGVNRARVEERMFAAVRARLGGICCKQNCENSAEGCRSCSKSYEDCTSEDKGLFADVRFFQMGYVNIPENVRQNNLLSLTKNEDAEREFHLQKAQLIRKETERIVEIIANGAEEVSQNATAQAALIVSRASAESRAIVEDTHNLGLSKIFNDLNITTQEHKASLNYIRTLRDHTNVFLGINFDSLAIRVYGNSGGGG